MSRTSSVALRFGCVGVALLIVSGCSFDSLTPAPSQASTDTTVSGVAAVGAPITDGKLRIVDADGALVAENIAIDAAGQFAAVALTGPAPWRLEACGYAAENYRCVYSVVTAPGKANITPLTTATLLLATNGNPSSFMTGPISGLDEASISAAQDQLRGSLGAVLSDAGVPADFDFISGQLDAGSREGYDRVLDAIGVTTGEDAKPFVQITPRIGSGNVYLEQGSSSGTVSVNAGSNAISLDGIETLFQNMSAAVSGATECADPATGMAAQIASNAHISLEQGTVAGQSAVADALCGFFAGNANNPAMWGTRLMSPTLGRCDLSGAQPLCRVSFVLRSPEGEVQPVGSGMGVVFEGGSWKFLGSVEPLQLHANANVQRSRRIDGGTVVDQYDRALAFEIEAVAGLQCARVSQRDATGAPVTIAYYKPHAGAVGQRRLSLWTQNSQNNTPSTDPVSGTTRSADDSWVQLPAGDAGDAVVRNFYRGGRSVSFELFSDSACSTAFSIGGASQFDVDVEGVPPTWSAMASLPWPELSAASSAQLRDLTLDASATADFAASWTFPMGVLGVHEATFCSDQALCGEGGAGRIGHGSVRPGSLNTSLALRNGATPISVTSTKLLALYGRSGEGLGMQSNFLSCSAVAAGQSCQ